MARRRETLVDALLVLPWWASVIVAATVFALLKFAAPLYFASSPYTVGIAAVAKNNAALVAGFFLLIGSLSFIRVIFIKRRFNSLASIEHVRQLSWRHFESIVGEAFRRRGYSVMENAVDGPDGGIDLVLRKDGVKFYVQCKQWKQAKVGVKPIRELYGVITAADAAGGFFVASGEYTHDARDFARKCAIEVIDGPALVDMIARRASPSRLWIPRTEDTSSPRLSLLSSTQLARHAVELWCDGQQSAALMRVRCSGAAVCILVAEGRGPPERNVRRARMGPATISRISAEAF